MKLFEKIDKEDFDLLRKELSSVKAKINDREQKKILDYFDGNNSLSTVLSPDVFGSFLSFAKTMGFPATEKVLKGSIQSDVHDFKTIMMALTGAGVLIKEDLPLAMVDKVVVRDWDEDPKKNPDKEVVVYDYDPEFMQSLGIIMGKIGLKSEEKSMGKKAIFEAKEELSKLRRMLDVKLTIREEKEWASVHVSRTQGMNRIGPLSKQNDDWSYQIRLNDESNDTLVSKTGFKTSDEAKKAGDISLRKLVAQESKDDEVDDDKFFKHLDDETVDEFGSGLLLVLAELEAKGKIPKFEKASDVRAALKAAVRKLGNSQSELSRIARKYQRFGAERVLRSTSRDIRKAQHSK